MAPTDPGTVLVTVKRDSVSKFNGHNKRRASYGRGQTTSELWQRANDIRVTAEQQSWLGHGPNKFALASASKKRWRLCARRSTGCELRVSTSRQCIGLFASLKLVSIDLRRMQNSFLTTAAAQKCKLGASEIIV